MLILILLILFSTFSIAAESERGLLKVGVGDGLMCFVASAPLNKADTLTTQIKSMFPDIILEDPALIDAEKKTLDDDIEDDDCDSLLCWAASISNTLWAADWGTHLTNPLSGQRFTSEDDIMKYFIQSFTNKGLEMECGFQWIFDGVSQGEYSYYPRARLKRDISEADALAPQYSAVNMIDISRVSDSHESIIALDSLLEGKPLTLSIEFCSREDDEGDTHAVTAMGLIVNPAARGTDEYYRYILLANSDNSVKGYEGIPADQRPNILTCYPLRLLTNRSGENVWEVVGYSDDETVYTRIRTIYSLPTYGSKAAEAAVETDPQATRNAQKTLDLVPGKIYTSQDKSADEPTDTFVTGSDIWLNFTVINESYVLWEEGFSSRVTVTREQDEESVSFLVEGNPEKFMYMMDRQMNSVLLNSHISLKSGRYRVTVEVNPPTAKGRLPEAYYMNNTVLTQSFVVTEAPRRDIQTRVHWIDQNKKKQPLPQHVNIHLLADGSIVEQAKLSSGNNWSFTFPEMQLYHSGTQEQIIYTIVSEKVDKFDMNITGNVENGFDIFYTAHADIPQTGDNTNLPVLILSAGTSLCLLVLMLCLRKRI